MKNRRFVAVTLIIVAILCFFSYSATKNSFFFDDKVSLVPARHIRSPHDVPEAKLSLAYLARELKPDAWAKCVVSEKSLTMGECERLADIATLLSLDLSNCSLPSGGFARIVAGNPRLHYIVLVETDISASDLNCVCDHPTIRIVLTSDPHLSRIRQSRELDCKEKFAGHDTVLYGP